MNNKSDFGRLFGLLLVFLAVAVVPVLANSSMPVKIEGEIIYQDGRYLLSVKKMVVLSEACDEIKGSLYRRPYDLAPEDVHLTVTFEGRALKTLDKCRLEKNPVDK